MATKIMKLVEPKPNLELLAKIVELEEMAESGNLQMLAFSGVTLDGYIRGSVGVLTVEDAIQMIGLLEFRKHRLMQWLESAGLSTETVEPN